MLRIIYINDFHWHHSLLIPFPLSLSPSLHIWFLFAISATLSRPSIFRNTFLPVLISYYHEPTMNNHGVGSIVLPDEAAEIGFAWVKPTALLPGTIKLVNFLLPKAILSQGAAGTKTKKISSSLEALFVLFSQVETLLPNSFHRIVIVFHRIGQVFVDLESKVTVYLLELRSPLAASASKWLWDQAPCSSGLRFLGDQDNSLTSESFGFLRTIQMSWRLSAVSASSAF